MFDSRRSHSKNKSMTSYEFSSKKPTQLPNLSYAPPDAFSRVGSLSSRRVAQNDYYYKYLDHLTPGSCRNSQSRALFTGAKQEMHKNFIPFE